jgi:hypothetical protein
MATAPFFSLSAGDNPPAQIGVSDFLSIQQRIDFF